MFLLFTLFPFLYPLLCGISFIPWPLSPTALPHPDSSSRVLPTVLWTSPWLYQTTFVMGCHLSPINHTLHQHLSSSRLLAWSGGWGSMFWAGCFCKSVTDESSKVGSFPTKVSLLWHVWSSLEWHHCTWLSHRAYHLGSDHTATCESHKGDFWFSVNLDQR